MWIRGLLLVSFFSEVLYVDVVKPRGLLFLLGGGWYLETST